MKKTIKNYVGVIKVMATLNSFEEGQEDMMILFWRFQPIKKNCRY